MRFPRVVAALLSLTLLAAPAVAIAQQGTPIPVQEQRSGRSLLSTVLHTVGGAVVGGWVGWMGSQVALSDWDRSENGELMDRRAGWVVGGAITGMIASQFIGSTSAPAGLPGLTPSRTPDRNVITRAEIEASGATNAWDLIQSLRSEWLRAQRGYNQWSESATGYADDEQGVNITPGESRIIVYLDNTRLGGLQTLREVNLFDLQRAEFVGPTEASSRYGTGHTHGVIQLWTVQ